MDCKNGIRKKLIILQSCLGFYVSCIVFNLFWQKRGSKQSMWFSGKRLSIKEENILMLSDKTFPQQKKSC